MMDYFLLILNAIIVIAAVYVISLCVISEAKDVHQHLKDMEDRMTRLLIELEETSIAHREKIAKDQKNVSKQIKRQVDAKEIP